MQSYLIVAFQVQKKSTFDLKWGDLTITTCKLNLLIASVSVSLLTSFLLIHTLVILLHALQDVHCVPQFRHGKDCVKTVLNLVVLAEPGDVVKGEVSLTVSFGNHWGKHTRQNCTFIFHLVCFLSICSALINISQLWRSNQLFSAVVNCSMSEQKLKRTFTSVSLSSTSMKPGEYKHLFRKCQKADVRHDEVTSD